MSDLPTHLPCVFCGDSIELSPENYARIYDVRVQAIADGIDSMGMPKRRPGKRVVWHAVCPAEVVVETAPRSCNRHYDCRAVDAARASVSLPPPEHCHIENCRECFGG